jgi:hypothetical protein
MDNVKKKNLGRDAKVEQIMIALKMNIEFALSDKKTITQKADALGMDVSDLAKILKLKSLISLQKILLIEKKLGIEILMPVFPSKEQMLDVQNKKYLALQQVQTDPNKQSEQVPGKYDTIAENLSDKSVYKLIKRCKKFNASIDLLLGALEDILTPVGKDDDLEFKIRLKERYISINMIPKGKEIGGIHVAFIRFYPNKPKMYIEFIVQNTQFEQQLKKFSQGDLQLQKGVAAGITNVPETKKNRKKPNLGIGLPNFTFYEGLTDSNIIDIVELAKDVYYIQSGK